MLVPAAGLAQTQYLQPGSKEAQLLQRLEIRSGNPDLMFSGTRPMPRRQTVYAVEAVDSTAKAAAANYEQGIPLTAIDRYNMDRFLMDNNDWAKPRPSFSSGYTNPLHLYQNKSHFYEVNQKDFYLAVNPILQVTAGKEKGNGNMLFLNTRGISLRGMISRKIGFNVAISDNQERTPLYVQRFIKQYEAVPGQGFYKLDDKGTVDYFYVNGNVSWNVAKYIDMQFGYDKNFIGDGYRSLLLSDFSNNTLFLKLNTRIWKFNYEVLFMELYPKFERFTSADTTYSRKYARMSYLTINAAKWLNVGLFEGVMFGRENHFDFAYLNPVIFLRPMEQHTGSGDNAVVGLTAKANIKKRVQLYGQLLFDEFKLSELTGGRNWWANKYGYQLGLKYIDAFGLKNVDIQLEDNRVRPFTYSHNNPVAAYTHYNQPFAHPLGASFQEYIGLVKAQPAKKLYLQGKAIYYYQGLDSAGVNMGGNPFENYLTRPREYGFQVGEGNKATCLLLNAVASYELFEQFFLEGSFSIRNYKTQSGFKENTQFFSVGFRWNMARRDFDF